MRILAFDELHHDFLHTFQFTNIYPHLAQAFLYWNERERVLDFQGKMLCLRCSEPQKSCMKINGSNRALSGSISVSVLASQLFSSLENTQHESPEMLMTTGFTVQGRYSCSFLMLRLGLYREDIVVLFNIKKMNLHTKTHKTQAWNNRIISLERSLKHPLVPTPKCILKGITKLANILHI